MKDTVRTLAALAAFLCASAAWAQSNCSSDAVAPPSALFERFISADCEACWLDLGTPAPSADARTVVLDWIVPGTHGEEAPLSAAATRDALERLQALGRTVPGGTDVHVDVVEQPGKGRPHLRVGRGPVFNDYVGVTASFSPGRRGATAGPWTLRLFLVESVPAAAEGSAVARNLVRNSLQRLWDGREQLSKKEHSVWRELRPMRVPDGAREAQLQVVGWVQDAHGRAVAAARSVCR